MTVAAAIAARGLAITYPGAPRPALAGIDLAVPAGACLLVIGPSGSGKSTLGLAIAGLIPRDIPATCEGSLTVAGLETRDAAPGALAATVGLVGQDPSSQIVMDRVEDDVAFGLENRAWPWAAMHDRVPQALAEVGLDGLEREVALELSGGQRQRLALAGVLAPRPRVLVLDEPTSNLDPAAATAFLERLSAIRASRAATIVLVEHRVDAAWPLADRVLALGADGRPLAVGEPAAVLEQRSAIEAAGIWLPGDAPRQPRPGRAPAPERPVPPDPVAPPRVEATGVRFGYEPGRPILRDIDLSIGAGERIALVGANGSGKSTLGRLLVGLLRPTVGAVRLDGSDPARLDARTLARRAGYAFQEPERQFLTQRVRDEVLLGLTPDEAAEAEPLMADLGLPLDAFGERSPYRLSGGEQRRLSLAAVLVRRPGVIVLDEPTFGQDRHGYEALLGILERHVDRGATLILATHDDRLLADVASRVVTLADGWILDDEMVAA